MIPIAKKQGTGVMGVEHRHFMLREGDRMMPIAPVVAGANL